MFYFNRMKVFYKNLNRVHDDGLVAPSWFRPIRPNSMRLKQLTRHQTGRDTRKGKKQRRKKQKPRHHTSSEVTPQRWHEHLAAEPVQIPHPDRGGFGTSWPRHHAGWLWDVPALNAQSFQLHLRKEVLRPTNVLPNPPKLRWWFYDVSSIPCIVFHFATETWNRFDHDRHYMFSSFHFHWFRVKKMDGSPNSEAVAAGWCALTAHGRQTEPLRERDRWQSGPSTGLCQNAWTI